VPKVLQGILIGVLCPVHAMLAMMLASWAFGLGFEFNALAAVGLIAGGLYGLEAGILVIYDLNGKGWWQLVVDCTWALPSTALGLVFGNAIYIFFGTPSRAESEGKGWIVFLPRSGSTSRFGRDVLQTLGTVNLGGAGAHELVHVLQARVFGPLYLAIYGLDYALNFIAQCLWCATIGPITKAAGWRDQIPLYPPSTSAVGGFWGWIYAATLFEIWAYSTEPRRGA
jgi:hypothetical protein